ncbi:hypothetical protein BGZ74_007797 [Mortierella antarctica]|nr:hypothetical protein BGZ74_007797 [Mortierella antarctica]
MTPIPVLVPDSAGESEDELERENIGRPALGQVARLSFDLQCIVLNSTTRHQHATINRIMSVNAGVAEIVPDSEEDSPSPTQAIDDILHFQAVDHSSKEHAAGSMELSSPNSAIQGIDRVHTHGESTGSMQALLFPESTVHHAYDSDSRSQSAGIPESIALSDSDELLDPNHTRAPSVEPQQTLMRSESPDSAQPVPSPQHPEVQRPALSGLASSLYNQPVKRSYPLRERTFEQRQPYTADKQNHARLIRSRGISVRPILSGEHARGDDLAIVEQDDEDHSDYEEPAPRHRSRVGSPTALDTIADPASPWHLQDLDDDDLPTLDELRQQYSRLKVTYSSKAKAKVKTNRHAQQLPLVKIPPALSYRERQKLERFTRQSIEPLDEVDAPPSFIPQNQPKPKPKPKSRNRETDKEGIGIGHPPPPRMRSGSEPFGNDRDNPEQTSSAIQDLSDTPTEEEASLSTKKTKRPRQHVLPMAFFKKNLLPDDAAALKSMRARRARSHTPDRNQRGHLEHPQLAHHAKRRIAPATQGVALDDFMAQLAQEGSESEEEVNTRYSHSVHHMDDDFMNQGMHRPTAWRAGVKSHAVASQRKEGRSKEAHRLSDSSSSSASRDGRVWNRPKSSAKGRSNPFSEERRDVIDRMTVRPSHGPPTNTNRSKKRRRISGNLPSTKARRPANSTHLDQYFGLTSAAQCHAEDGSEIGDYDFDDFDMGDYCDEQFQDHRQSADRIALGKYSDSDVEVDAYSVLRDTTGTRSRPAPRAPRPRPKPRARNYGSAQSRPRPIPRGPARRTLCRSTVIPRTTNRKASRKPALRTSSAQSKPMNQKPRSKQMRITAWDSLNPTINRPQFVNKPYFELPTKVAQHFQPPTVQEQSPHRDNEYSTIINTTQGMEQDWDEDHYAPSPPGTPPPPLLLKPRLSSLPPFRQLYQSTLRHENYLQQRPRGRIQRGIFFSRESFIGRGTLSAILRTITVGFLDPLGQPRNRMDLYGRSLFFDYDSIPSVVDQLSLFVQEFSHRFQQIQESDVGIEPSDTVVASQKVLEDVTVLILELMAAFDYHRRIEFWDLFMPRVLSVIAELTKSAPADPLGSDVWRLTAWTRWTVVVWKALAADILQDEDVSLSMPVEALLGTLYSATDSRFYSQVSKCTGTDRVPSGTIFSGQDAMELWICLIQLLNTLAVHQNSPDFWTYFNRFVRQRRTRYLVTTPAETGAGDSEPIQDGHELRLMMELCVLHQFDQDGSSNPDVQVVANWDLVNWLLQDKSDGGFLQRSERNSETEQRLRWLLGFCHDRIQTWGWSPDQEVVTHVYRFFSAREFQDMPMERGYRLPEFLKQMVTAPLPPPSGVYSDDRNGTSHSLLNLLPSMEVVTKLDDHDRCFEIFLKILALTLRAKIDLIGKPDTLEESLPTPISIRASSDGRWTDEEFKVMNREDHLRACKKLLASISPVIVTTISASNSSDNSYSSLCNPCNLVLMTALLVPDFVRQSSVGQLRSLLNFDNSDDASRRILLESVYYLGFVWQRKALDELVNGSLDLVRPIDGILDYFCDRVDSLCSTLEADLVAADKVTYLPRRKRNAPVASLIETVLGYMSRLLGNAKESLENVPRLPSFAFLDERLGRILNPSIQYPPELRLQVVGIVETFLSIRGMYMTRLQRSLAPEPAVESRAANSVQPLDPKTPTSNNTNNHSKDSSTTIAAIDDDFSSFEYDPADFDDMDLLDFSQPSETVPRPSDQLQVPEEAVISPPAATVIPEDKDLVDLLQSWIYPCLENMVKARHQALHDEHQSSIKLSAPSLSNTSRFGLFPSTPTQGSTSGFLTPSIGNTSVPKTSNMTHISQEGVFRILSVLADCGMFLLDQGKLDLMTALSLFKRDPWLSLTIQYTRLTDELAWATRVVETRPWTFLENEDVFLSVWFSTAGVPLQELTLQHRLLCGILHASTVQYPQGGSTAGFGLLVSRDLFKDLPIAHLHCSKSPADDSRSVDRTLMDTEKDAKLFQEFKESRIQLLGKVLENIGEHYLAIRPEAGSADQQMFHRAHLIKTRYQGFLGLLLNQIKKDYERLESKRMVKESLKHVELAHIIVGQVIQQGGLIMQHSQLSGAHESVLNYLTSPRHFPQPRNDGVYFHQKIRGFAYLYKAGEKQSVGEFLDMLRSQLKLVFGENRMRFDPAPPHKGSASGPSIQENGLQSHLGIRVVDAGVAVYGASNHEGDGRTSGPVAGTGVTNTNPSTNVFSVPGQSSSSGSSSFGPLSKQPQHRPTIANLVANQGQKKKTSSQLDHEALRTLTSSLRNVALETEDRKQWNQAVSSFRTMTLVAVFSPLLTAFIGIAPRQNYCGTSRGSTPARPTLIPVAIPAVRWLISLIKALKEDISALTGPSTSNSRTTPAHAAYEGLQLETSLLFRPLLQCLFGCVTLIPGMFVDRQRTSLIHYMHESAHEDDTQLKLSEDDRHTVRAMHLFGQVLECLVELAHVARKLQHEHKEFYERNAAWRDALLELLQFAFDQSFQMMMRIGGPTPPERSMEGFEFDGIYSVDHDVLMADVQTSLGQDALADRIPGAQDAVALESVFLEFLAGQRAFPQFEDRVYRDLQNMTMVEDNSEEQPRHPDTWAGDILAVSSHPMETRHQQKDQQYHQQQSRSWRMKRQHWALWSFQSSFFDFCQAISNVDPRFHRQVQRALSDLLKSPSSPDSESSGSGMGMQPSSDSVWYHILHHTEPPSSTTTTTTTPTGHPPGVSSAVFLRWCLNQEWRLFLAEMGATGLAHLGPEKYTLETELVGFGQGVDKVLRHVAPSFASLFI